MEQKVRNSNVSSKTLPSWAQKACTRLLEKVDNTIHRINHYPAEAWLVLLTIIHWIAIYPVDSVIQPLNNWGADVQTLNTLLGFKLSVLFELSL